MKKNEKVAIEEKGIKIITVDGAGYLGMLVEDGNKVVIKDSLSLGETASVSKTDLVNYLATKATGKLNKDIVIRGANATFGEQELSDDLAFQLEILEKQFAQAERDTVPELVANKFRQLAR